MKSLQKKADHDSPSQTYSPRAVNEDSCSAGMTFRNNACTVSVVKRVSTKPTQQHYRTSYIEMRPSYSSP